MTNSDAAAAFPATLGRAAFWPVLYPEGSRFCGQVPALLWLVETLRPATVLGLGLTTGEGYFALCQAIHGLGTQSLAWGFGAWEGGIPEPLQLHNAAHYADFSRLTRMPSVPEVADRFEGGLFDLILVDGRGLAGLDGNAVAALVQRLSSPRGVVMVQGTAAADGDTLSSSAALLAALVMQYPVLRFDAQTGCSMILTGSAPQRHLKALAEAPAPVAEIAALDRLGASHLLAWQARAAAHERAEQESELAAQRKEAADLRALMGDYDSQLATVTAKLSDSQDLRLRDLRLLTAQLEALTERLRQTQLDTAAAETALRQDMQIAAETAAEAAAAELAALRLRHFDETTDMQSEIFVLTQDLGKARQATDAALQALQEAEGRVASLTQDLAAAETTHQTEMAARLRQISELEQTLALRDQTCAAQQAQIAALRQDAARRDALHQVQMKLRDWQLTRLSEKPRFGGPPGPSGGKLTDEVAAVAAHPLFDAAWYQSAYPDTQDSALSAAEHFLRHGFYEGRNPGPRLQLLDWFAAHPQALAARKNPLLDPNLVP